MTETVTRPLPSFATLRELARSSAVAHACISLRQTEVRAAEWDVVPVPARAAAMRGHLDAMRTTGERRAKAVRFFRNPDPAYASWSSWLEVVTREILETDSLALYARRTVTPGKGLLGSGLAALEVMDGATLAPPATEDGDVIHVLGAPVQRVPLAEFGCGCGPHETDGLKVARYGPYELLYRPMRRPVIRRDPLVRPREWPREPFGRSPLEDAIAYADDGSIDLPATDAKMPAAFGISRQAIGMAGEADDPGFALDEQVKAHLKGVFDFVLHSLCDAPDLEWAWLKGDLR